MNIGISNWHVWSIDPTKWGFWLYFFSIQDYWPPSTWNSLVHTSYRIPTHIWRDTNAGKRADIARTQVQRRYFKVDSLRRGGLAESLFHYGNIARGTDMVGKLYFDPKHPTGLSTYKRLHAAARWKTARELSSWFEEQDAYTLHRPVRKRFQCNPYTVNNIKYVWECD